MRSFISVYMNVFLEHVESLETVSRAEIATLQRLDDVYMRKAFATFEKSEQLSARCIRLPSVF